MDYTRRITLSFLCASSLAGLGLACSASGANGDSAFTGARGGGAGGVSGVGGSGGGGPNGGGGTNTGGFGGSGGSGAGGSGAGSGGFAGAGGNQIGGAGGSGAGGAGAADSGNAGAGGQAGVGGGGTGDGGGGACGTRAGMRGKTSRSLMVGGAMRTYIAYLPQSASPTQPLPFVYVFHGASQSGQIMYDMTQYATIADSDGVAVVFPDGQGGAGSLAPWSVADTGQAPCGLGSFVNNANPVDFAFVDAMKADILQDQCLDTAHVFATGFSMGGYMSHHIACDRPDFRAAAPHSGGTIASLSSCKTTRMPIIMFHGLTDGLIVPGCDDPNSSAVAGFPPSATLWAQKNGCKTTYQTVAENGTGGGQGQCYVYDGCPSDGQVELCTFANMQHVWAGSTMCQGCIGGTGATWASATALQWAFFKKYAW